MSFAQDVLLKEILFNDVDYSAWADKSLLDGCSALSSGEVERDLGISHASILATLRHIYDGERVWLGPAVHNSGDGSVDAAARASAGTFVS